MYDRVSLIVQSIDIGFVGEQQAHQGHVPLDNSQMKWRESILVSGLQELWSRNRHTGGRHEIQLATTIMKCTVVVVVVVIHLITRGANGNDDTMKRKERKKTNGFHLNLENVITITHLLIN